MLEFLKNNFEFIFGSIGIASAIGQWLYNKGKKKERSNNDIDGIRKEHSNLECIKNSNFAESVKESVIISKANNKLLTTIAQWIMKEDSEMIKTITPQLFGKKCSPIQLSELGAKIYNEINGEQWLVTHKQDLYNKIELNTLFTALDVEKYAYNAVSLFTNTVHFNDFKNYVYNAPALDIKNDDGTSKKYEITLNDIYFILSIPLRNMYLEEHPEILK